MSATAGSLRQRLLTPTVGYAALLVFADTGLTSGAQRGWYDYPGALRVARP